MAFLDEYDGSMRVMQIYGDGGHVVVVVSVCPNNVEVTRELSSGLPMSIYISYIIINARLYPIVYNSVDAMAGISSIWC